MSLCVSMCVRVRVCVYRKGEVVERVTKYNEDDTGNCFCVCYLRRSGENALFIKNIYVIILENFAGVSNCNLHVLH